MSSILDARTNFFQKLEETCRESVVLLCTMVEDDRQKFSFSPLAQRLKVRTRTRSQFGPQFGKSTSVSASGCASLRDTKTRHFEPKEI